MHDAVAVHGQVLHHVHVDNPAIEVPRHAGRGVGHGLGESDRVRVHVPCLDAVVGGPARVDQRLPRAGRASDGQLLQCSAVSALGMALEVGENQHGIVVQDVLPHQVALQDPAVVDLPSHVGPLGVHEVHPEPVGPSVLLKEPQVGLGVVSPNLSP